MGSVRLPGKVMLDIGGQSMLERVVHRVRRSSLVDQVVVATPSTADNDVIADVCDRLDVAVTRGSEDDVLDRFHQTAAEFGAETCVRVCADSPFVDPGICDACIALFHQAEPPLDYVSNKLTPTFPLGLDVEAFAASALDRAWAEAKEPFQRSHVTVYMYQNPESFRLGSLCDGVDRHEWRWTVDTMDDIEFARSVIDRLGRGNEYSWRDVVELVSREPALSSLNAHVTPKPVREG